MRARQLELTLAGLTPRSKADLDLRHRQLRAEGLLPTGGRGPNAPDIDARGAAIFLIACGASRVASDAAQGARRFGAAVPWGRGGHFADAPTFWNAMEAILQDGETLASVHHVEMRLPSGADWSNYKDETALIVWTEDGALRQTTYVNKAAMKNLPPDPIDQGKSFMIDATIMGGGLLAEVALAIAEDEEPAGYASDRRKSS